MAAPQRQPPLQSMGGGGPQMPAMTRTQQPMQGIYICIYIYMYIYIYIHTDTYIYKYKYIYIYIHIYTYAYICIKGLGDLTV
jgi:hypothetical protein